MNYTVIYADRKTVSIQLGRDGSLTVRAPRGMSRREINEIVSSHQSWIDKKRAEQKPAAPLDFIYLLGAKYPVIETSSNRAGFDGASFYLPAGLDDAEKRAAISASYAARRGLLATSRSREDIDAERNRLAAEAGAKRSTAGRIESTATGYTKMIASLQGRLVDAGKRATALNDEDRTGYFARAFGSAGNLFGLRWGNVDQIKTEAGDKIRSDAQAEVEKLKAELKRIKKEREEKLKEAERLRTEAQQLDEKAVAVYQAQETVDVKETTARVTGQRGMDDAETSLENKNKEIAKKKAKEEADRATIAQGPGRIAAIEKKIAATEAQQLAAKQADAKEQTDAILAQQALDSFNSAGHRRNGTGVQKQRSELEADVERETREAAQSRAQLQSTLATLAATLKGLNADLNKVKREVDAATKRQAAVNDEAPEG